MLVHATAVDVAGLGVLIMGASGAGKSDLALRLIARGAFLVADDQTEVTVVGSALHASAPERITGLIEARGVGIAAAPRKRATRLALAVVLIETRPERMPEPHAWFLPGTENPRIPLIDLDAFEVSAAEKVCIALQAVPEA
jgi:serine kinase of HPr protein (carbohydrate metabolism regulator)